jgi:hypothetical protein
MLLAKLKVKVNAAKHYCPPIKRHEIKQNNPFFNGALGFRGIKNQPSPPHLVNSQPDDNINLDRMFASSTLQSKLGSVQTTNILNEKASTAVLSSEQSVLL